VFINAIIQIITYAARLLQAIVLLDVILSYFMSPYSSIRITLDRIVGPLIAPIRKVIPPLGMIDISPIILLLLIQVVAYLLVSLIAGL
jgi:YggT family protein